MRRLKLRGTGSRLRSVTRRATLSRSWRRSTIMSIAPFSSRNSERWKPSGSVSRTVCSMTRGPAKPMSAPGSAMHDVADEGEARRDAAHGRIGEDRDERLPRRRSWCSAAVVFAICMSERRPSCMRAPPVAVKQMKGKPSSQQACTARTKRSPTTEPIEPPRKPNSNGRDHERDVLDRALHHDEGVGLARLLLRFVEALAVLAAVLELERVERHHLATRARRGLRDRGTDRGAAAPRGGCGSRTSGRRGGCSRGR